MLSDDIKKLKNMIYKAKTPLMDNSHEFNFNDADKILNRIYFEIQSLEKDKQELAEALKETVRENCKYCALAIMNQCEDCETIKRKKLLEKHYNKKWEDI